MHRYGTTVKHVYKKRNLSNDACCEWFTAFLSLFFIKHLFLSYIMCPDYSFPCFYFSQFFCPLPSIPDLLSFYLLLENKWPLIYNKQNLQNKIRWSKSFHFAVGHVNPTGGKESQEQAIESKINLFSLSGVP